MIRVGALGAANTSASVDGRGRVHLGDLTLDWWIGADDRWHVPAEEVAVRQTRAGGTPVVETAVRVPGGDAVQRVYGVPDGGGVIVVEVENVSPAPFVVAFVLAARARHDSCTLAVEKNQVSVDDAVALVLPRRPARWATGARGSTRTEVCSGGARDGPIAALSGPEIEATFLYPVPHRTVLRVALGRDAVVDVTQLPTADKVRRGWDAQLDRALRTELPEPLQTEVDAARAALLLTPADDAAVFVALEDWGFDPEARAAWARLGFRDRGRARRRAWHADAWAVVQAHAHEPVDPPELLAAVRDVLVHEHAGGADLLPGFPPDWLGQDLAARDVPLRGGGTVGFALRWHGARPALLWDAPPGCALRAPALDAGWATAGGAGEALLAEPPARLLPLAPTADVAGQRIEEPGSFS